MGRITELVDRCYFAEAVAAVDQDFRIARESGGIARHRDNDRDAAFGKLPRLRLGALARWIEHDRFEAVDLLGDERTAKQVAPLRRDRPEPAGGGSCTA